MKLIGLNSEAKIRSFQELYMKKGIAYRVYVRFPNGHAILSSKEGNKYILFKKEFFHTFPYKFPELVKSNPLFNTEGESLNVEVLKRCKLYNCNEIIILHPQETYKISLNLVLNFCTKHKTIRGQDKLNKHLKKDGFKQFEAIQEETYSFPMVLMQKMVI